MNMGETPVTSLTGHRPFVLYWLSRVSATVALQMQAVAIGWQMYDLTRNPLDLGLVGLFHFIPAALLVLVAGPSLRTARPADARAHLPVHCGPARARRSRSAPPPDG